LRMVYQERNYRHLINNQELQAFHATVLETDLFILADSALKDIAVNAIHKYREHIECYIKYHPEFLTSLFPLKPDPLAPDIIVDMLNASALANVGPMAAVAGSIAQHVGCEILRCGSKNVVVENGGDIFMKTEKSIQIGIFAGRSPLSEKIGVIIKPEQMPLGVCTSSGTVGHSLSLGKADAVCVVSKSAAIADAAATAIGNLVKDKRDIKTALRFGISIEQIIGVLIIVEDQLGVQGDIELI
jgi:uncharacterized protein